MIEKAGRRQDPRKDVSLGEGGKGLSEALGNSEAAGPFIIVRLGTTGRMTLISCCSEIIPLSEKGDRALRAVEAVWRSICEECNKESNRKKGKYCWVTLKYYGPIMAQFCPRQYTMHIIYLSSQ